MTPPIDDPETLRRILANTDALLIDFDGPMCSVFAGIPASVVADQLRGILAEGGYIDLPADVRSAGDPFEVLFYAAKLGQNEARYVEAAFRAHEVEAVQSAEPTPGCMEFFDTWRESSRPLAIVSNNSVSAVETYLQLHDLTAHVDHIAARSDADVSRLKPNCAFLLEAAAALSTSLSRCSFVGDSTTDMQAARAAGTWSIAYANKPGKDTVLATYGPDVITTSMYLRRYL